MTGLDKTFSAVLQRSPSNKLVLSADLRAQIGKDAGDEITVHLDERIQPTPRKRSTR
jgi:hypothetical protein